MTKFDPEKLARHDLKDLQPYVPGTHPGMVRMDANENPYDLPVEVKEYINQQLQYENFNRYPDPLARNLLEALGKYTGLPVECISAGNGSDEIILDLTLAFAAGGKVIITPPTFSMYEVHSRVVGAEPVMVPRKSDFSVDIEEILKQEHNADTRIIFICSPNNPTANETARGELREILQNTSCLVVVDEAYVEFGGSSCLPLLDEYPNLAVMRSFSKSFGLAGLRVGYLLARPGVVEQVKRIKQPFNLNTYSQVAALAVMEHLHIFQDRIEGIIKNRDNLYTCMQEINNVEVYPTVTNFILFKTGRPSAEVQRGLMERGILIRDVSGPGIEDCLRVSVGTEEENRAFLESLQAMAGLSNGV